MNLRPLAFVLTSALLVAFAPAAAAQQKPPPATPPAARLPPAPGAPQSATSGATRASMAELRRLGDAFADVAEKVSPSVVQIDVTVGSDTGSPLRWFKSEGVQR